MCVGKEKGEQEVLNQVWPVCFTIVLEKSLIYTIRNRRIPMIALAPVHSLPSHFLSHSTCRGNAMQE